jgi:hypothetical protein
VTNNDTAYTYAIEDWNGWKEFKWTTDPPTEAGVYWIRVREEFEKEYEIIIADVAIWTNGNVYLNFPVDGFECEDKYDAKFVTHWLGPLPTPEPPQ